jgi:AraC-like DNA-binding protein
LQAQLIRPLSGKPIRSFRVGEPLVRRNASLATTGHFSQIARALRRIHSDYDKRIDVDSLSNEIGMSVPAFHHHFKAVTHTTPIQYLTPGAPVDDPHRLTAAAAWL